MALKIVTDSTVDLPLKLLKKHNIKMVPLTVNFENESFLDKIEISTEEFFDKLVISNTLPTTSQVSPGEFVNAFNEILSGENEILGIFIASELSGTTKSALIAKDIIGSDKIHIIDSRNVCLGLGALVLKAVELIENGMSTNEIIDYIKECTMKIETAVMVDTLKYLEKGGRLSKKQAFVGSLLNVKPILRIEDGQVLPVDKVRGKNKAIKWIKDWIQKNDFNLSNKKVVLLNAKGKEMHEKLKNILIEDFKVEEIIESEVGAVVGTHAGPGCVGIAFINN